MQALLDVELFPPLTIPTGSESCNPSPVETYHTLRSEHKIVRHVLARDGQVRKSHIDATGREVAEADAHGAFDAAWLRSKHRPTSKVRDTLRVVDLFSGCGALSLGISEACRALELGVEHVLAADINPLALNVYSRNFPGGQYTTEPLETLVARVDDPLSREERHFARQLGRIDVLAGGPPCQGHSDLNNHTRRDDPKNALFGTMIRFAQVLRPKHVLIENVPGVRNDKRRVTDLGRRALERMGYHVFEGVALASDVGAAQRRRRYFMIATSQSSFTFDFNAVDKERTLRWACEDLSELTTQSVLDSHASSSRDNKRRIDYLFDNDLYDLPDEQRPPCHRLKRHSYQAVYGRLHWDEPAPTITSGFNSPGQGRFIHPFNRRTLTPHEAARVQFIPDFFDWGDAGREGLTQMIGNAVPPKLGYAVALELLR